MRERKFWGKRQYSIRSSVFFSVVFFLVIPFGLTVLVIDRPIEQAIKEKIGESAQGTLSVVGLNLERQMDDMMSIAVNIANAPETAELAASNGGLSDFQVIAYKNRMFGNYNTSYITESYSSVLDLRGHLYASWFTPPGKYAELARSAWFQALLRSDSSFAWLPDSSNYTAADIRPLFSVAMKIKPDDEPTGIVLFSITQADVRRLLQSLRGSVLIVNNEGRVMYGDGANPVGSRIYDRVSGLQGAGDQGSLVAETGGVKNIVFYRAIRNNGWKVVQIVPYDELFKQISQLRKINFLLISLIFIAFSVVSLLFSFQITKPLNRLNKKMSDVERNPFAPELEVKGPREIASLMRTFNKMTIRILELIRRLEQEYEKREELRFRALQSQINPHFILNTLNNIKWMAYLRQNGDVADMLSSLGAIMEMSLGKGGSLIALREEVRYIDHYITLQKIKYNDKLTVTYEIPESLLDAEVIKFMLQPVVENAIYHGIEPMHGKGEIHIAAKATEGHLVLAVQDNGIGMDEARLEGLRRSLQESGGEDNNRHDRIGMANVQQRIQLQYGYGYGLQVERASGGGTLVTFVLPYRLHVGEGGGDDA